VGRNEVSKPVIGEFLLYWWSRGSRFCTVQRLTHLLAKTCKLSLPRLKNRVLLQVVINTTGRTTNFETEASICYSSTVSQKWAIFKQQSHINIVIMVLFCLCIIYYYNYYLLLLLVYYLFYYLLVFETFAVNDRQNLQGNGRGVIVII
jgi:hypothetical protein